MELSKGKVRMSPVLRSFDATTGIARITFNRPSVLNALDLQTAQAFEEATDWLQEHGGLRCVVLRGEGKAFMAGGDVTAFAANPEEADRVLDQLLNHMHPAILTLRSLEAPVIAAINGTAAGAGLSLALAADYVVARASARLVLAYDKLGAPPDCGGSWFLARKLGRGRAFEMMLTGRVLTAEEGLNLGIVNVLAGDEDFDAKVEEIAHKIASGPTKAFGMFKTLMDTDLPLAEHLEAERSHFIVATRTEDFREAVRAFVEKRTTAYRGS